MTPIKAEFVGSFDNLKSIPSDGLPQIAFGGRSNVGKSTLLNQLTGSSRAIVSPVPGTTRDAVDEVVERVKEFYKGAK